MNMNMFNPEMMNQMKNMMDGKSMKNMLGNITSMSDDQIRMYLSASGMGHISPQTFRQMAGQMNNMDENELERLKNMAPNGPRPGFPMNQPYNNSAYSTNKQETNQNFKNESNVNKTNSSSSSSINDYNYSQSQCKTILDKLERIKIEGNNFFRQGKYKEACEKYYEILNEMDYISDSEKITYQKQLEDMEMVCRLNIANTKIKQEDYDLVIHECLKVLKKSENFKAHYRAGIAYYKKGSHQKAYHHLMRAKDLNKDGDAEVERYLKECKIFVEELEEEKRKSELENEKKIEVKKEEVSNDSASITNNLDELKQSNSEVKDKIDEPFNNDEIKFKNPIKSNQDVNYSEHKKTSSKIEKLKEIVDKEVKIDSSFKNVNNKPKDDIEIEENTQQRTSNFYTQQTTNPGFIPNIPHDMSEKMSQAQKHLENMDDSQFEGMASMLRSMDNATIKSMMSMQGMNMSDEQIEMLKNVNPQMLKMAKKNFNPNMMTNNFQNNLNSISNTSRNETINNNNTSPPQTNQAFPNLNNMDFNSMLKMMQDNPQLMNMMGPQMANMFGGSGANQQVIMNSIQSILWLMSLPQRIKAFLTSTRGILLISIIVILVVAYFYNR